MKKELDILIIKIKKKFKTNEINNDIFIFLKKIFLPCKILLNFINLVKSGITEVT
jgi:hypothetical protein